MLKYVEFCAGIGGMRAGLDATGWECALAIDNNPDAVIVHRLAHGDGIEADVLDLEPESLPDVDAWVAGFPCQPFSTSGTRLGFGHKSGNVFEHLARLIEARRPALLIFENVDGLLTNKSGHTFAVILSKLTLLGYRADWFAIDPSWFGVPQTRPRVFIIASRSGVLKVPALPQSGDRLPGFEECVPNMFARLVESTGSSWVTRSRGSLEELQALLAPAIGKRKYSGGRVFGALGHAVGDQYVSMDCSVQTDAEPRPSLAEIVAPNFRFPSCIRSGRYYARGGPTKLCLRSSLLSHCVGTSLGGAPLYAVPLSSIKTPNDRAAFLELSNWHREEEDVLVLRLRPDRAILLFGPHTERLSNAMQRWEAGETRKHVLVGNMVAPICAATVAGIIDERLLNLRGEHLGAIGSNPLAVSSLALEGNGLSKFEVSLGGDGQ